MKRARELARSRGLRHVYTGNIHDPEGASTWCSGCGARLIERDWYQLGEWNLDAFRRIGAEVGAAEATEWP